MNRLAPLAAVILLLSLLRPSQADIVVPGSIVEGKSIAEWTGEWWNWAVKEPFATNPLADTTGAFANLNQTSPVFFLAGNFGDSTPYVRNFAVPTNRYLLMPIANYVFWAPEDGADEAAIRAVAKSNVDSVNGLFFQLDGVTLANPLPHREASPAGGFTLKFAPLLNEIGLSPMDRLAVADGYWVMIEPLTAGAHQIRVSANQPGQFTTNITLNITAVPEPSSMVIVAGCLALRVCHRRRR